MDGKAEGGLESGIQGAGFGVRNSESGTGNSGVKREESGKAK